MPHHETVRVALASRSYEIRIGTDCLADIGPIVAGLGRLSHAVVITDTHVEKYATRVVESLAEAGARVDLLIVEPGEATKSVDACDQLWQRMLRSGTDRRSRVVAVGGGVVGDLAGFAAAAFARGLAFVQVPTTLLAQVDSSVGGKVGVNLPGAKNMVGAFWQPAAVVVDTATLDTLPEREFRAGLAEVIKYGVILDAALFEFLERSVDAIRCRDAEVLRQIVARCCRLKADVVETDEREETGQRAVLNYGHTFCHAIEAVAGYGTLLHGEGVAIGMICASRLAERLGRIDADVTERQRTLLAALGLPVDLPAAEKRTGPVSLVPELDRDELLAAMARDKKVAHGQLRFVLPDRLGHVELVEGVAPDEVRAVLEGSGA